MKQMERISDAELEILKLLWESGEALSSAQINDTLKERMGWEKSTTRTLVARLLEKRAISQEKRDMYYYSANVMEKDYLTEQTKSFLSRLYKGNAKDLVASLVEQDYIKPEDIDELRAFWKEGEKQ